MTPAEHVAETLRLVRASIEQSAAKPTLAERDLAVLRDQVIELLKLAEDGIVTITGEDSPKFMKRLESLAEEVGFDADEYREQGYDRKDV